MEQCNQSTITDKAFLHLTNLKSLKMGGCDQSTITGNDEAFRHLGNLRILSLTVAQIPGPRKGISSTITAEAVYHLSKLRSLEIDRRNRTIITTQTLRHLTNLESYTCIS